MDSGIIGPGNPNYWLSLLETIEARQDIQRLSTVKSNVLPSVQLQPQSRAHFDLSIPAEVSERILKITNGNPEALLLATWHTVLHVYSYSAQTVVGVFQDEHGLVPSLVSHDNASYFTFSGLTETIQKDIQNAKIHTEEVTPNLREKFHEIIDNVFAHADVNGQYTNVDVPIVLLWRMDSGSLFLKLEYSGFDELDVTQLLVTFGCVLNQISFKPEIALSDISFVTSAERKAILSSSTLKEIPLHQTMATIFEEQVDRVPNNIAVITETTKLTYMDLDTRANQLAHWIRKAIEVKPDTILALCLDQTEQIQISILAVWKAGAAYVAIDPNYPTERKAFILEDTNAALVLTDVKSLDGIAIVCANRIIVNIEAVELDSIPCSRPTGATTNRESLSHVVYTSGTTGRPKGVLTTHKALLNHCVDYKERYTLDENEVVMLFFNYVFNAFSEPLTLAFSNGFPLLIVQKSMLLHTQKLHRYMEEHGLTHIDATPSLLGMLDLARITKLKRVATGGEILIPEVYEKVTKECPNVLFYNVFGNSEGTLCTMTSLLKTYECSFQRHVTNKQCLVLSSTLSLLPLNAVGELCFSGIGVARGYLNNEQLTSERFLPNAYQQELGHDSKLFRTGDLGRRLPNGSIEYLGRRDLQIKIRGFRVELGEIESAIISFPGITRSAVISNIVGARSEEVQLTGFYLAEGNCNPEAVRAHIQKFLPEYMIPTRLTQLDEFPLTPNGKIDRKGLLDLNSNVIMPKKAAVQEEILDMKSLTKRIRNIWEEFLNIELNTVDCDEDFFVLGGNSLMAMTLGERLGAELGITLNAAFLYDNSTVNEFAENIKNMLGIAA